MLDQYGAGTPDDWLERKLYTPHSFHGVGLMLAIDLLAFGAIGATVWAVQMLWIPVSAAGIVNGIGHWWGYRNFEVADASRNIVPWGIVIGGEELHNNHHTYPASAKLSVRRHEFDLGWAYIRGLEKLGLATVRRIPPQLRLGSARPVADATMLDAVIANRYEFMANYARRVRRAVLAELAPNTQDTALTTLEKGESALPPELRDFFSLLLQNTKEGYFADPMYGGNHGMAAWVYIGFPGARANFLEWTGPSRDNMAYRLGPVSISGERA